MGNSIDAHRMTRRQLFARGTAGAVIAAGAVAEGSRILNNTSIPASITDAISTAFMPEKSFEKSYPKLNVDKKTGAISIAEVPNMLLLHINPEKNEAIHRSAPEDKAEKGPNPVREEKIYGIRILGDAYLTDARTKIGSRLINPGNITVDGISGGEWILRIKKNDGKPVRDGNGDLIFIRASDVSIIEEFEPSIYTEYASQKK